MNKITSLLALHKKTLLACFAALLLYAVYQFYPQINQIIGFGMFWTIGRIFPPGSMWLLMIAPWFVAGLLCATIAIIYWLAGIKNPIIAATLGFSISYFVVSLFTTILEAPSFVETFGGIILAYILFLGFTWLMSKFRIHWVVSTIMSIVLLGLSLYFTPIVTNPIVEQRVESKAEDTFKRAVEGLDFIPYYPTYQSSVYTVSAPKLNGYEKLNHTNETVTFLLGKAYVKQGALLKDQDKVMNFTSNCSFWRIWYAMEDGNISQQDIEHSQEYPKKCNLIQTTPTGKRVFFEGDGQWVRFYTKLNNTNLIIEFDDINGRKYDPSQREEILKIIDSLEPLDKSRLEDGNRYGHGFSS